MTSILAARLAVVVDDAVVGKAPIAVTWTDDATLAGTPEPDGGAPLTPSVVADLPTGRSPVPRQGLVAAQSVRPSCPDCGLRGAAGDRFCERCGAWLGPDQKS